MFFNEDHLRITKVKTIDGTSPLIGLDERPVKKIVFAPLNPQTVKLFEDQNTRLPTNLKMKIEKVAAYRPEPLPAQPSVDVSALEKKISELEAANKTLTESNKVSADAKDSVKETVIVTETKTTQSKNIGNDSK